MEGLIHGGAFFRNFTVSFLSLLWVLSLVIAGSTRGPLHYDFDNSDGKDNVKKYKKIYIGFGKQTFSQGEFHVLVHFNAITAQLRREFS